MRKLMLTILFFLLLSVPAYAAAPDVEQEQYDALQVGQLQDSLPGAAADMLAGVNPNGADFSSGFTKIIENIGEQAGGILRQAAKSAALLMVLAILTSLAEVIFENVTSEDAPQYITLAGTIAVAAVALGNMKWFLTVAGDTITQLSTYSKLLLPTLTAAATASGALTSAAAKYTAAALFMNVLITGAETVLMPLVYAYAAAVVANAAVGGEGLQGAANVLKWAAVTGLTIIMLAFIAFISITGIVTSSADVVTTRVAKTAISTLLPVVGSIVGDAASSIVAGAGMVRNTVGVFGLLAVTAMCAVPFLTLAVHYLFYKVAAGVTAAVSGARISKLIGGIGTAFGMMMGITGSCAVILYFSVIALLRTVGT